MDTQQVRPGSVGERITQNRLECVQQQERIEGSLLPASYELCKKRGPRVAAPRTLDKVITYRNEPPLPCVEEFFLCFGRSEGLLVLKSTED